MSSDVAARVNAPKTVAAYAALDMFEKALHDYIAVAYRMLESAAQGKNSPFDMRSEADLHNRLCVARTAALKAIATDKMRSSGHANE